MKFPLELPRGMAVDLDRFSSLGRSLSVSAGANREDAVGDKENHADG